MVGDPDPARVVAGLKPGSAKCPASTGTGIPVMFSVCWNAAAGARADSDVPTLGGDPPGDRSRFRQSSAAAQEATERAPSTGKLAPLTKPDSSASRNAQHAAISSGSPRRPAKFCSTSRAAFSGLRRA